MTRKILLAELARSGDHTQQKAEKQVDNFFFAKQQAYCRDLFTCTWTMTNTSVSENVAYSSLKDIPTTSNNRRGSDRSSDRIDRLPGKQGKTFLPNRTG